jgi:hypothetical protein
VLVGVAAAILASTGDANAKKRTLCPGGRFVVHERPLFVTNPTLEVDGLTFMPEIHMLAVSSGCPLNPVKLKAKKNGTKIRGIWTNCTGVVGKVRLKARIDSTCSRMKGKLRAKRAKFKRKFVATVSRCGDAILDREAGEQCDVKQACAGGQLCSSTCTCGPGGPGAPQVDLTVTRVSVPEHEGEAGTSVVVSATIKNLGPDAVTAGYHDAVYLSRDDTFSRDDKKVADIPETFPVAAGESYDLDVEVPLPLVPSNAFYLIVRTDDANQVAETNEQNNALAGLVFVTAPNLVPTQLQDQPDRDNPRLITVSWTVLNDGDAPARPTWQDVLYLSLDETLDASDLTIWPPAGKSVPAPLVEPHERYEQTVEVTLSPDIPAGHYFLILGADAGGELFENHEDDNLVTEPIRVD